jgi:CDP-paratose 2-epimerase
MNETLEKRVGMKAIITGGAGFIGINAASRFASRGDQVVLIDNLSRHGAAQNLEWLGNRARARFYQADVRDATRTGAIFREHRDADLVLHLASQVAVTTSVADPRSDFEINALGTLNVLEAMRLANMKALLIYSSTNKVYGAMEDVTVAPRGERYAYTNLPHGIPENRVLDFHSPYGCSKGAADQYVRDYHRIYGLNTVVFRQSCIYGPRQFGIEDQGWVAWLMIAATTGRPITIYGDGRQVRDVLDVEDLLDVFEAAADRLATAAGRIYNIGGGPENAISLRDVLGWLETQIGKPVPFRTADWRPGDQRVYVSDIRSVRRDLEWSPKISWQQGLERLYDWIIENRSQFV